MLPVRASTAAFLAWLHRHHGGNIQVLTAPDGWPLWVSPVRPGRESDLSCTRAHPGLLDTLDAFTDNGHVVPADLAHPGEAAFATGSGGAAGGESAPDRIVSVRTISPGVSELIVGVGRVATG